LSIVSDSSPIIGLHNIGQLDLIGMLFHDIVIPPAVAYEVQGVRLPGWVTVVSLRKPVPDSVLQPALGLGETEAISLALEIKPERTILARSSTSNRRAKGRSFS
jgi:predicted nucleic acid-binding protein